MVHLSGPGIFSFWKLWSTYFNSSLATSSTKAWFSSSTKMFGKKRANLPISASNSPGVALRRDWKKFLPNLVNPSKEEIFLPSGSCRLQTVFDIFLPFAYDWNNFVFSSPFSSQMAFLFSFHSASFSSSNFLLISSSLNNSYFMFGEFKPPSIESNITWRLVSTSISSYISLYLLSRAQIIVASFTRHIFFSIYMPTGSTWVSWIGFQRYLTILVKLLSFNHSELNLKGVGGFLGLEASSKKIGEWSKFPPEPTH